MAIVGYKYRIDGGAWVDMGMPVGPLTFTVPGLAPSTEYDTEVVGYDSEGNEVGLPNVATASTHGPLGLIMICAFVCDILAGESGPHFEHTADGYVLKQNSVVHSQDFALRLWNDTTKLHTVALSPTNLASYPISVSRFYIRFGTLPSGDTYLFTAGVNDANQMGLFFDQSEGKLYAATGNPATKGASGISVTTGVWYRVDIRIIQTSGDRSVDVEVDGTALGSAADAVATSVSYLAITSYAVNSDVYYDSMYISDEGDDFPIGAGDFPEV